MRITWLVGILMMNAMRCHPKYRSALKCQGCAERKEVFHPFWSLVASVCEQPVIAHANSEASGNPPQKRRKEECFPREEKQSRNCPDVKGNHERGGNPVNLSVGRRFLCYRLDVHDFLPYRIRYPGGAKESFLL